MDLMLHSPRLFFPKVWNIIFGTKRLQYSVSELIKMEKKEAKTSYHVACALQGKTKSLFLAPQTLVAATALAQRHQE
jgi:hypothetical protein